MQDKLPPDYVFITFDTFNTSTDGYAVGNGLTILIECCATWHVKRVIPCWLLELFTVNLGHLKGELMYMERMIYHNWIDDLPFLHRA